MSFLALKEDGSQTPGMEIESPVRKETAYGVVVDRVRAHLQVLSFLV
jgi:hypothetical protein